MMSIPTNLAASGSACQAASGEVLGPELHTLPKPPSSFENFKGNLELLMQLTQTTQNRLARLSGVGQRSIGRILKGEQIPSLDICDQIAHAFGLRAWQMLLPNINPQDPPQLERASAAERRLFDNWREVMLEMKKLPRPEGGSDE